MELVILGTLFGLLASILVFVIYLAAPRLSGGIKQGLFKLIQPTSLTEATLLAVWVLVAAGTLSYALTVSGVLLQSEFALIEQELLPRMTGLIYFLAVLAGMAGQYMFGLKKWKDFRIQDFARPFWVALILFGVVWGIVDQEETTLMSLIASYQNGFFWKTILDREQKSMAVHVPTAQT
jgi:hypothetical protein